MRVLFRVIPPMALLLSFLLGPAAAASSIGGGATDPGPDLGTEASPSPTAGIDRGEVPPPMGSEEEGLPTDIEYVIEQFVRRFLDLLGSGW